jgi:hypothetical protein
MKRWLFITGIIFIVILTAIWVYLLFFGAPTKEDLFNAFDFGDTTDESAGDIVAEPEIPIVVDTTSPEKLRQLTTRPVAGFTEITTTASSTLEVYYVEAGTGHVYSINIVTGEENRISNITVPVAQLAVLSKDGKRVVIKSGDGHIEIITINDDKTVTSTTFDEAIQDFSMSDTGELLYSTGLNSTTLGLVYDFETKISRTLFEIPFRGAVIDWGDEVNSKHYAYPKAASLLGGALYSINKGVLNREPISGYGLTAHSNFDYSIFAKQSAGSYLSYLHNFATGESLDLFDTFLPDKCAFSNSSSLLVCANTHDGTYDLSIPDAWYQGVVSYADDLWLMNLENSETILLTETLPLTGRELDIIDLQFGNTDETIYFRNKNDQTLWLFSNTETESTP